MLTRELLPIPLRGGHRVDVNSGVARLSKTIWATMWRDTGRTIDTAVLIVHPSSNFLGHYALEALAERGVAAVGLATRYVGNDSMLIMENCVLDVAAAITELRRLGFSRVVLVGNSGGGGLAALYQEQAERPDITATPAGDGPDLTQEDLPAADSLVLAMAHPGRATVYTEGLDPAVTDEHAPFERDPSLDLFAADRVPPFDQEFLDRYRAAQVARNRRITEWAQATLGKLRTRAKGAQQPPDDLPFLVHGTAADPRFVDLSLDPSDREPRTLWGEPWAANFQPSSLGHHTSLRSWLSQWSLDLSRANAPRSLPQVTAPVQVIYGSADCAAFPSHAQSMYDAIAHDRRELVEIKGADHYFQGRPDLMLLMCDHIAEWAAA